MEYGTKEEAKQLKKTSCYAVAVVLGAALGLELGATLGVAMGNIAMGIPIGIAIGASLGGRVLGVRRSLGAIGGSATGAAGRGGARSAVPLPAASRWPALASARPSPIRA